jgi:hypothetical protein
MPRTEHDKTFLEGHDDAIEQKARLYMLDAVACEMHNEGYGLQGNTEDSDVRWFARVLYQADGDREHWDSTSQDTRDRYIRHAKVTLEAIPSLMARMSNRCIRISKAVNTIIKAEKLNQELPNQKGVEHGKSYS